MTRNIKQKGGETMKRHFRCYEDCSKGGTALAYKCYYCDHEAEKAHFVTFYTVDGEHDEPLCDECYAEWLASLKE